MARPTGIRQRHGNRCTQTGRCDCPWEASVYSHKDSKKIRRTFKLQAEAKAWRDDANNSLRRGTMAAPSKTTVRQAWEQWHEAAKAGVIRNKQGERYKPAALRSAARPRTRSRHGSRRARRVARQWPCCAEPRIRRRDAGARVQAREPIHPRGPDGRQRI